jgi:hypothetical protein
MKRLLFPFAVLSAKSVTGAATYVQDQGSTAYTDVRTFDNIGYHFRCVSGTPDGEFKVEGSNDASNWVDLGLTGLSITSGVFTGSVRDALASINQFPFAYIRAKYVNASGSGVVTVIVSGKGV